MSEKIPQGELKISILGDDGVGKHTIINSILEENDRMSIDSSHIGMEIKKYNINIPINEEIKNFNIEFRIISGQERDKGVTHKIYENVDCFIIVYDISNKESFKNIKLWYNNIKKISNSKDYLICVIGNKISSNREVDFNEAQKVCNNNNFLYYEYDIKKNNFEKIVKDFIPKIRQKKKGELIIEKDDSSACCGNNNNCFCF